MPVMAEVEGQEEPSKPSLNDTGEIVRFAQHLPQLRLALYPDSFG